MVSSRNCWGCFIEDMSQLSFVLNLTPLWVLISHYLGTNTQFQEPLARPFLTQYVLANVIPLELSLTGIWSAINPAGIKHPPLLQLQVLLISFWLQQSSYLQLHWTLFCKLWGLPHITSPLCCSNKHNTKEISLYTDPDRVLGATAHSIHNYLTTYKLS